MPSSCWLLHAFQQLHGTRTVEQEVLVHHEERLHAEALFHVLHDFEELVAGFVEVKLLPLPPKKAEVVQKLQPIGHPTEGIMVAAVSRVLSGTLMPRIRKPKPERISGWTTGAQESSPR